MIYTKNLQPDITLSEFAEIYFSTLLVTQIPVDSLSAGAKRHFASTPDWASRKDGGLQTTIGNKKIVVLAANANAKNHWRVFNTDTDELIVKSTAQTAGDTPDAAKQAALNAAGI